MNEHLAQDIFEIVLILSDEEINQFINDYKPKKDGDKEYLKLFQEYVKQKDSELNIGLIKKKFPNHKYTNKNLKKKLYDFMKHNYLNIENEKKSIDKIRGKLLIGKALIGKDLFDLAEKEITVAFETAKELYYSMGHNKDNINLYLTEAYFLLCELQIKNAKYLFENNADFIDTVIKPTILFCSQYNSYLFESNRVKVYDELWGKYSYYETLKTFFREKKEYDKLNRIFQEQKNKSIFSSLKNDNDNLNSFLEVPNLLQEFELLFLLLKNGDKDEFKYRFQELANALYSQENNKFNTFLVIFLYRELYRLRQIYSTKTNSDFEFLIDLSNISKKKLYLFQEDKINNVIYQFYANDLIIKFSMEKYDEFIKKIQEPTILQEIKENLFSYYCRLRILFLFAHRIGRKLIDKRTKQQIEREMQKFLKDSPDEFYKKLKPFYEEETYHLGIKSVSKEKFEKLEQSASELDHFHQVILSVLRKYVKFD
jgi:hypothetical protein